MDPVNARSGQNQGNLAAEMIDFSVTLAAAEFLRELAKDLARGELAEVEGRELDSI